MSEYVMTEEELNAAFAKERHLAAPIFEDCPCYPVEDIVELVKLQHSVWQEKDLAERARKLEAFVAKRNAMKPKADAPQKVYLWPEGRVPTYSMYFRNEDYRYNRDPGFEPYLYELLLPEDVTPKGAVLVCAGADHGDAQVHEGYQTCRDFLKMGYQTFLLCNRTNACPWHAIDTGADVARALRMIRKNADKYRIKADNVAFAGFSNGGLSGEDNIQYYSGSKSLNDYYPNYVPDELDTYYGAPDAFLCVYGPRFVGGKFDFTGVVYPPTFFAVGRKDTALDNFNYAYPTLLEHNVPVEIHTFAGVPNGQAGIAILDGESRYPNFQLWLPLADAFLQDVFHNK